MYDKRKAHSFTLFLILQSRFLSILKYLSQEICRKSVSHIHLSFYRYRIHTNDFIEYLPSFHRSMNICLDSDPSAAELMYDMSTRHSHHRRPPVYTRAIMDFNFSAAPVGSEPCIVQLMVENTGAVPCEWYINNSSTLIKLCILHNIEGYQA